jgi:hypothetical protein
LPSFLDIMEHLLVHVVEEVDQCDFVQLMVLSNKKLFISAEKLCKGLRETIGMHGKWLYV